MLAIVKNQFNTKTVIYISEEVEMLKKCSIISVKNMIFTMEIRFQLVGVQQVGFVRFSGLTMWLQIRRKQKFLPILMLASL